MTIPCKQGDRITALEITNKYMTEKIDSVDSKVDNLNEKLDKLIDSLEDKFVLRTEFKVGLGVLSALGLAMSLFAYFAK